VSAHGEERRIGETVGGKYRVVRFLAAGGMGVVYEAQHTVVRRRFAVKFLRPELAAKRESLARFQREAQAAGALESEHVAAAVDFGVTSDGAPFIVMEYLVGESLEALLEREGPLPFSRATDLVRQACRGIQAAHAAGVVHRDLKPQNLFLSRREDGTDLLKVLDFGVAKLEAVDRSDAATLTGTVLGTPAYMSPEQARGERTIDHRADVYALGAILYELVSGRKPHPGDSHNAILHHIATQPAVPLDFVDPPLPEAFVAAVARALASDPGARFASAELLAEATATFAERKPWPAPERVASSPVHDASEPTELAPNAAERAKARTVQLGEPHASVAKAQSGRTLAFVVGALVLGLVAWWRFTTASEPHSAPPVASSERGEIRAAAPVPAVNAGEIPLPVAAPTDPTPAPSAVAPSLAERRDVRRTRNDAPIPASSRVPAARPETSKSPGSLAFDRQNPYD
jgi:eukaryotic-like serine/threonine-protein kinase